MESFCSSIDAMQINFGSGTVWVMNLCIAIIMFGVALELRWSNFKDTIQYPKAVLTGVCSQFFLLPFLTYLLVLVFEPCPSMALGMFMVAACPGGNISNFISLLAKGNIALSVSLTAVSTTLSLFMVPINFAFWSGLYPETANLLAEIYLNNWDIVKTILLILALPVVLGVLTAHYFPKFRERGGKYIRGLSVVILLTFIVVALGKNMDFFLQFISAIIFLVFVHNGLALLSGYSLAKLLRLPEGDARTISIETGIQNSGLGLALVVSFFSELGGMAIVVAWWGIWHIIAGFVIAIIFSRFNKQDSKLV